MKWVGLSNGVEVELVVVSEIVEVGVSASLLLAAAVIIIIKIIIIDITPHHNS